MAISLMFVLFPLPDAMIAEGIQPLGTIYHWDLPQWIEDKGGWLNESLVVEEFSIYSRALFENFGDRVTKNS